jgi:hypothetical protein
MTITELNNKYSNGELSLGQGNKELRFKALSVSTEGNGQE